MHFLAARHMIAEYLERHNLEVKTENSYGWISAEHIDGCVQERHGPSDLTHIWAVVDAFAQRLFY